MAIKCFLPEAILGTSHLFHESRQVIWLHNTEEYLCSCGTVCPEGELGDLCTVLMRALGHHQLQMVANLKRGFCLAGFQMEQTMARVNCISTGHILYSSCITHPFLSNLSPKNTLLTLLYWLRLASPSELCSRITSRMKLPFDEATCF